MRWAVWMAALVGCGGGGGGGGDGDAGGAVFDGSVDGAVLTCESDEMCTGDGEPYCRDHVCVGCGEPGESAFCNAEICGEDGSCRECESNSECESGACFHACIDQALVLYVESGAPDDAPCTRAAPCGLIQHAVDLLPVDEPGYLVIGPGTFQEHVVIDQGVDVSVSGDGALIESPGSDLPALVVDNTRLTVLRLALRGGSGAGGHGLMCLPGEATTRLYDVAISQSGDAGIHATGCTILGEDVELSDNGTGLFANNSIITLTRFQLAGNDGVGLSVIESDGGVSGLGLRDGSITGNAGGGIEVVGVSTDLLLVNLIIAGNGTGSSAVGGVRLVTGGANQIHFVTVADNQVGDAIGAGVHCESDTLAVRDSIVYDNAGGTGQLDGCIVAFAVVGPEADFESETVTSADPAFVAPEVGDYDLGAGSSAIGCADLESVPFDIHGDPRDDAPDCGADEYLR